jgi:hypothetical protein
MPLETWEQEVAAGHRWGQHGDETVQQELTRLRELWNAAQPVDGNVRRIIDQIVALEICNWNLEESILCLCQEIGANEPAQLRIGHLASVSEERWRSVWAYYSALRDWLPGEGGRGYPALLSLCDPDGEVRSHIRAMLGDRDELKELYVERLCLCLQRWLRGYLPPESVLLKGHFAAARELENEIEKRDVDGTTLDALRMDGDGRLQPCSHKAFRRYDIIISSIGCGKWRGTMPTRGTDGFERADLLASYLDPIDTWIEKGEQATVITTPGFEILSRLGKPDERKRFLGSLLVSVLRAQEIAARRRAESRLGSPN